MFDFSVFWPAGHRGAPTKRISFFIKYKLAIITNKLYEFRLKFLCSCIRVIITCFWSCTTLTLTTLICLSRSSS